VSYLEVGAVYDDGIEKEGRAGTTHRDCAVPARSFCFWGRKVWYSEYNMRFIFFFSALAFVGFSVAQWYVETKALCPVPISYRVGEVDARFAISASELRTLALQAEMPWEEALGRELFVYDETADFTVNLIFDERQQLASTEEEWRLRLDTLEQEHEELVAEIKELGVRYQTEEASYNTAREAYEERLAAYNNEVEQYNAVGGAPASEFARLEAEAASINRDLTKLVEFEGEINDLATRINELGAEGNQKIADYNAEVVEYNEIFGTLETFTQGEYERERITVYKFTDAAELHRVITHEFGHALGVPHVEGEDSVMYYLMTDRDVSSLSQEDTAALVAVCGTQETWPQKIRHFIRTTLTNIN